MTTSTGPQVGVTLYSFTNAWLNRKFDLDGLLREVAKRGMGPNIEIIGFQTFKEFPDVSDEFAEKFKELMAETGLNAVSCAINSDRFLKPGQQPIDDASLVEYHKRQLRSAKKMGFDLVRYQFALPVELLPQIAPYAEELDIRMGVEVHAPMWAGHPAVQAYGEMYDKLNTPYLGWIPDFGGTASRIPESMLNAARAKGAKESLLDRLKEIWLEPGMSHEKAGKLREWAIAEGHDPLHIQAQPGLLHPVQSRSEVVGGAGRPHHPHPWQVLWHARRRPRGSDRLSHDPAAVPRWRIYRHPGQRMGRPCLSADDGFEQVEAHQVMCRKLFAGG